MRAVLVVAFFCILPCVHTFAQTASTPPPAASETRASDATVNARVPVPEPTEQALAYHRSGNVLWVINSIWGLLIPGILLFTGFSARMRTWAQSLGRKWFFVIGLYFLIFSLITFVIDLPLSYYQGFVRQHAYGLSNQTFEKWASDELTGLMVGIVMGILFLWVPYLLLAKSPRRWWLYTGLLAIPFIVLVALVQPIWIDPLFNEFGPMKDKALEADILRLAERAGIEGSRVFEVAKSEDTKAINAYVAGVGGTSTRLIALAWRSRATTTERQRRSSRCSRRVSACRDRARSFGGGAPAIHRSATESISATTIGPGRRVHRSSMRTFSSDRGQI